MREELIKLNQKLNKIQNKLFCLSARHFLKTVKYRPFLSSFVAIALFTVLYLQPNFRESNGFNELDRYLITIILGLPLILLHLIVLTKPEYLPNGARLKRVRDYYLKKIAKLKKNT